MAVAIMACKPAHSFYLKTALGWCQVWGWNFHTGPEKAGEKNGERRKQKQKQKSRYSSFERRCCSAEHLSSQHSK